MFLVSRSFDQQIFGIKIRDLRHDLLVVRWQSDVIEVSFDIHVCNVVL